MLIFNDQGIIQMINRQLTRITGFGAADVLGKSVDKFLPEDVKSEHAQHMSRFMEHPQGGIVGRDRKLFCARKDGTEFPVDIALSPIRSSFDKLVAASIRDISDRIAYEESLEANELRLEQALRSGKMEAWEMELETQQSSSSLFLYESFGYKPEDVAPGEDPWRAIIEKDDLARLSVSLQSFRRGEKSRYRETYRVRSASGEYRWIESTATPSLISSDGKVVACVGARVDITERMNSELTLKNKMAELEDFNKLAVDRELRMIELKKEINNLLHKLNKKEKYVVTEQ
jgi:PAS domain S-box-containing protein